MWSCHTRHTIPFTVLEKSLRFPKHRSEVYCSELSPVKAQWERHERNLQVFWIHCSDYHQIWVDLIPHTESQLNNTAASATGFTPTEFCRKRTSCFWGSFPRNARRNLYQKTCRQKSPKLMKRETKRRAMHTVNLTWTTKRCWELNQYQMLQGVSPLSSYILMSLLGYHHHPHELADKNGHIQGQPHKKLLKPYKEAKRGDKVTNWEEGLWLEPDSQRLVTHTNKKSWEKLYKKNQIIVIQS